VIAVDHISQGMGKVFRAPCYLSLLNKGVRGSLLLCVCAHALSAGNRTTDLVHVNECSITKPFPQPFVPLLMCSSALCVGEEL
jgi:hypothetical protein